MISGSREAGSPTADRSVPEDRSGRENRGALDLPAGVRPQTVVWFSTLTLVIFGMVMVFSTSSVVSMFEDSDSVSYLLNQAAVAAAGLVVMAIISRMDYRKWGVGSLLPMGLALILLVLVLIPGMAREAGGAARWLRIGPVGFQPSELAKLGMVLTVAYLLAVAARRERTGGRSGPGMEYLAPILGLTVLTCLLIYFQPDMGTTVLLGVVVMGMLALGGMRRLHLAVLVTVGAAVAAYGTLSEPYRRQRLSTFLDPTADPLDSGYQVIQSFIAMANGGWWGVGPGKSIQKFSWLPEAHTDMIFAVVGEEYGFVGAALVICLFVLFTLAVWRVAVRSADPFGRYLAGGLMLLVAGQAILNLGGVVGVLPLTGIPLPFISFGRSNLLMLLIVVGVILSVARYGPLGPRVSATGEGRRVEGSNVTYLDSRRRNSRTRSARSGRS